MERYLLQQPVSLEKLTIQSFQEWLKTNIIKIMSTIREQQTNDENKVDDLISRFVESIRLHLQSYVPSNLHDKIAEETFESFALLLRNHEIFPENNMTTDDDDSVDEETKPNMQLDRFGRMIEILLSKNITTLNLHRLYRGLVNSFLPSISKSNLLGNLVQFELMQDKYHDKSESERNAFIIPILKKLHNLKYLTLNNTFCTHEVLECLVENCKLMEKLCFDHDYNLQFPPPMTHLSYASAVPLTRLSKLKYLRTSRLILPVKIIEDILLSCERIEEIHITDESNRNYDVNEEDQVSKAFVNLMSEHNGRRFNLKYYENFTDTTVPEIASVIKMCPLLEEIKLKAYARLQPFQPGSRIIEEKHITLITTAPNLSRLTLFRCNFFTRINEFLPERGCNLKELNLTLVKCLDLDGLITLMKECPNLESLILNYCFTQFSKKLNDIFDLFAKKFVNLKRFSFSGAISDEEAKEVNQEIIYFVLVNSPILEHITIGQNVNLTNDIMSKVLDINPLIYLIELRLTEPIELSIDIINKIIRNCIKPAVIISFREY